MGEAGLLDDIHVELLDGELIEMPAPGPDHQYPIRKLLTIFVKRFGGRAIVDVNGPVQIDEYSVPIFDLALLALRDDDDRKRRPGATGPLLVVEVAVSSLRYDRGRKVAAFACNGVREVWIVDMIDRRVERHADLIAGTYATLEYISKGGTIAPRAFPSEAIDVDEFVP